MEFRVTKIIADHTGRQGKFRAATKIEKGKNFQISIFKAKSYITTLMDFDNSRKSFKSVIHNPKKVENSC